MTATRAVRRGAAIVGGSDHPAPNGCDAEHVEEPAADVRAVDGVALAARRQVKRLGGPRERAVEQFGLACPDFSARSDRTMTLTRR